MHRYFNAADQGPSLIQMLRDYIERRYDNVNHQRQLTEQYVASFHPEQRFEWDLQVKVSLQGGQQAIMLPSPKSLVLEHYSFQYTPQLAAHHTKAFCKQLAPKLEDLVFVSTRSGDVKAIHVGKGNPDGLEISGQQHRAYRQPPRRMPTDPYTMKQLCGLWNTLADIPLNEDDCLEISFLHFQEGDRAEEVWKWFESQHPAFNVAEAGAAIGPNHKFMRIH